MTRVSHYFFLISGSSGSGNSNTPPSPQTVVHPHLRNNLGEGNHDISSPNVDNRSRIHPSMNCCQHICKSACCNNSGVHMSSQEHPPAASQLFCKEASNTPSITDADVSAIVSALAKQQSEVEDQESEDTNSQGSGYKRRYERRAAGGKKGKYNKKSRSQSGYSSSDDNNTLSCPRYHISKDLHELSKMVIQATMLPRPMSEGNFKRQQEENNGDSQRNADDIQNKNKGLGSQTIEDTSRKRNDADDKHEHDQHSSHHGKPLSIPFHPLKTLQKTFHKSDTLYPPSYSSVAYATSQTTPMQGTLAPAPSPKSSHHNSPHQHHVHPVSSQHHSPSLSSFLKLSSSKASKSVDLTSGRLPKSSPLPKYKSKFAQKIEHKAEGSADATLTTPQTHGRDRSPSFGTIPQIVAPTPPGGLPVFVTPVASFEESTSGLTPETYKRLDKRAKYAKSRAKSSGAMK